MKSRPRAARFFATLLLLAAFSDVVTVRGESAFYSGFLPKARPILFHWHRGRLSASFLLANDATIRIGTNSNARLTDLRAGQVAHVRYTVEDGRWLAHEIIVNPLHAHVHGTHAAKVSSAAKMNELHAHGEVLGYDASTGRLTIRYHR